MTRQVKNSTERVAQSRQFVEFTQLSDLITRQKLLSRLDNALQAEQRQGSHRLLQGNTILIRSQDWVDLIDSSQYSTKDR
jgi:GGDEF domain-containing protein